MLRVPRLSLLKEAFSWISPFLRAVSCLSIPTSSLGSALLYLGMVHHMSVIFIFQPWLPGLAGVPSPTEAVTPTYGNRPETVASISSITCSSGFFGCFGVGCYTRERREGEERGSTQLPNGSHRPLFSFF